MLSINSYDDADDIHDVITDIDGITDDEAIAVITADDARHHR